MQKKVYLSVLLLLILSLTFHACKQKLREQSRESNDNPCLHIKANLGQSIAVEALLSDIAKEVNYVTLSPLMGLGRIHNALFTDSLIFIEHNGSAQIACFDREGKFLRNIGKIGKGPNEFTLVASTSLNAEQDLLYIQGVWDHAMHAYDFQGNHISTTKIMGTQGLSMVWHRDSLFVQFAEPIAGNEEYVFLEKTLAGDTVQGVPNFFKWESSRTSHQSYSFHKRKEFYWHSNKLHLKGWYNDTLYTFSHDQSIVPKYFIDIGSHRLKDDFRYEVIANPRSREGKYWVNMLESDRYLFLGFEPHTRGDKRYFSYFDKEKGSLEAIYRGDCFRNDLEDGPDFFPQYITGSVAYQFIEPQMVDDSYRLMVVSLK